MRVSNYLHRTASWQAAYVISRARAAEFSYETHVAVCKLV